MAGPNILLAPLMFKVGGGAKETPATPVPTPMSYLFFQFIYDNTLTTTHFTKWTGYGFIHFKLANYMYMSWMSIQQSLKYHPNFHFNHTFKDQQQKIVLYYLVAKHLASSLPGTEKVFHILYINRNTHP